MRKWLYRWRVRGGTICLAAVLILARPSWISILAGSVITLFGLGVRAWAAGHLRKEKELAVSGPYGRTRNPLYLGNLILGAGMAAGSASWSVLGILAAYFILFYPVVVRQEKERMKSLFPEPYGDYEKNVPLFFPGLKRTRTPQDHSFNLALYKKNREYRAAIGMAVFWGLMIVKIVFIP